MQPDFAIGGQGYELKTFSIQQNADNLRRLGTAKPITGSFEVSGTLTAYFESDALIAAFLGRPHKASVWKTLRPTLYRLLAYAALALAASFVLISGAL